MNPLFFGDSSNPQFGLYYPPAGSAYKNSSVLICPPIGHEYVRSYKALKNLSLKLSTEGYHVMRFDYFGTGDAAGSLENATLEIWERNIVTAYDELVHMSGERKMQIIAMRFGATLASRALREKSQIQHIIYWDPVVSGDKYVGHLRSLHEEMKCDLHRFSKVTSYAQESGFEELVGYRFSSSLVSDIQKTSIDLENSDQLAKTRVFSSVQNMDHVALIKKLNESGGCYCLVPDAGDWCDLSKIEDALLSSALPKRIVELLA